MLYIIMPLYTIWAKNTKQFIVLALLEDHWLKGLNAISVIGQSKYFSLLWRSFVAIPA